MLMLMWRRAVIRVGMIMGTVGSGMVVSMIGRIIRVLMGMGVFMVVFVRVSMLVLVRVGFRSMGMCVLVMMLMRVLMPVLVLMTAFHC